MATSIPTPILHRSYPTLPTLCFFQIANCIHSSKPYQLTLDDHSKVDPLLPFPNRTVKRLRADDSGWTSVKVGHRQALYSKKPLQISLKGFFIACRFWRCIHQGHATMIAQVMGGISKKVKNSMIFFRMLIYCCKLL